MANMINTRDGNYQLALVVIPRNWDDPRQKPDYARSDLRGVDFSKPTTEAAGIRYANAIVEQGRHRQTIRHENVTWHHAYDIVFELIDTLVLQRPDADAYVIPCSRHGIPDEWSHGNVTIRFNQQAKNALVSGQTLTVDLGTSVEIASGVIDVTPQHMTTSNAASKIWSYRHFTNRPVLTMQSDSGDKVRLVWGPYRSTPISRSHAAGIIASVAMSGDVPNLVRWVSPRREDRMPQINPRISVMERVCLGFIAVMTAIMLTTMVTNILFGTDGMRNHDTILGWVMAGMMALFTYGLARKIPAWRRTIIDRLPSILLTLDDVMQESSREFIQKLSFVDREPLVSIHDMDISYLDEFHRDRNLLLDDRFHRLNKLYVDLNTCNVMDVSDVNDFTMRMSEKLLNIQKAEKYLDHGNEKDEQQFKAACHEFDMICEHMESLVATAHSLESGSGNQLVMAKAREKLHETLTNARSITLDTSAIAMARENLAVRAALEQE